MSLPDVLARLSPGSPDAALARPDRVRTLALDALREPLRLYRFVIPAYWRTGVWRWCVSLWRSRNDLNAEPGKGLIIAGLRDPLPDRDTVIMTHVDGAHACHFSHPEANAERLTPLRGEEMSPGT